MQSYNKSSETNDTLLSNNDTILSKYKINYFYSQYSYGSLVSNEAYLILGRMYLKLHRDVSVAASGRVCYYVGTQQMLRRDVISGASVSGIAYQ